MNHSYLMTMVTINLLGYGQKIARIGNLIKIIKDTKTKNKVVCKKK